MDIDQDLQTIRSVAPEDLRRGDFVAVVHTTEEFLLVAGGSWRPTIQTARATRIPDDAGQPLKVVQVCVPFVLVKLPDGQHRTLDLRRHRLARLDSSYGRKAFKRLGPKPAAACTA